jgi:hypothetical protein
MRWLWLAAALLLGVAALAIYQSVTSPAFVAALTAVAIGAAWKAMLPGFRPRDFTPAERQKFREGESISPKPRHGGESL